jgi:hypothetical protein
VGTLAPRPHVRDADSPFNGAAADPMADNESPDVYRYGDHDG